MNFRSFFTEDELPGGMGDNLSTQDVDQAELQKGIEHEKEHTQDEALAKEIALDHLAENPRYYSELDTCMPEDDGPQINMPVGGSGTVPVGGIVMPQAFGISVSGGGISGDKMVGGEEKGVSQPGDKEPITAAGETDTSFAEKSVGGPSTPGKGQEQGGPNTQGCIASTPENSEIEGSDAPGTTPKNNTIVSGEAKGSTPKNSHISSEEESEESEEGEEKEDSVETGYEEEDDEEKVGELKEIIKSEIKSILKEMWGVSEDNNVKEGWAMGEYSPEQQQAIDLLGRKGFEEVSSFENPSDEGGTTVVMQKTNSRIIHLYAEVTPDGSVNGQPIQVFLKSIPMREAGYVREGGNWIKGAIKHPGALKAKDPTPGDDKLTGKDLDTLEKGGNARTKKQVNLARTLKKLHKEGKISLGKSSMEEIQQALNNENIMNEVAPPGFPESLAKKLGKQYGDKSPKKFATMWKIHNKGWVKEVMNGLSISGQEESKKK